MRNLLLLIGFLVFGNICFSQSIMPNDTADLQQVQNFEFINGNIILTSKAELVENGADFTNGFMKFEKSLGYPFRSLQLDYKYNTKDYLDTALIRLIFKTSDDTLIGQLDIPIYEAQTFLDVSIVNENFINADKFEVLIYSTGSPWIRDNSVLKIKSMIASNQISTSDSNYEVYPNPASTTTQISSIDGSLINSIQILNSGEIVVDQFSAINNSAFLLNVSNYISGIYYVMIYGGNAVSSKSLVVQH